MVTLNLTENLNTRLWDAVVDRELLLRLWKLTNCLYNGKKKIPVKVNQGKWTRESGPGKVESIDEKENNHQCDDTEVDQFSKTNIFSASFHDSA